MDLPNGSNPKTQVPWRPVLLLLLVALLAGWFLWIPRVASLAAPILTIETVTWNVIGLDSANLNAGPNVFPVSARVCNTGDLTAYEISSALVWGSSNQWIGLNGPSSLSSPALPAGQCVDFTYQVVVTRDVNAIGTARRFYLTATADGLDIVSTPTPREIYVQSLISQNNLQVNSLSGPTSLEVGEFYNYTLSATTGNTSYNQLVHSIEFPNTAFRVQRVEASYANPPNTTGDKIYLDACGWQEQPGVDNYLKCVGPELVPGGAISGTVNVVYTVEVIAEGNFSLTTSLYGYTNDTYVYNADFGQDALAVSASLILDEDEYLPIIIKNQPTTPTQTPTPTSTSTSTATPTFTGTPATATPTPTGTLRTPTNTNTGTPATATQTNTGTPPTPTLTGTISPNPGATKAVAPAEAGIGQNFTFTIRVVNNGSAPATNVKVEDSFSAYTYLDIFDLTTTKGTKNITGRVASVSISSINPGEVIIIRIVIRVNSAAPAFATPCNIARITYSPTGSRNSNQQCFRVRGGSSLPPTGELPIEPPEPAIPWYTLGIIFSLWLGGFIMLRVGIAAWKSKPRRARWLLGAGVVVTSLALFAGLSACGLLDNTGTPQVDSGLTVGTDVIASATPSATTHPLARLPAYMFATPNSDEPSIIETLPSYPIPTPSITIPAGEEDSGPDISAAVRMVIPKLELDAKVAYVPFDGQTWMIQGLRDEIAWLGDTSWPGLGGNTGFAGHVTVRGLGNGPFRFLSELSEGDEIQIYTEKNVYTYRVREQRILEETEMWATAPTERSQITLITCVDWNETIGIYLKRLIVIADQAQVAPRAD